MGPIWTLAIATALAGGQGNVSMGIYAGEAAAASGITLASWGGGTIAESTDVSIAGSHALMVRSTSYFQGGTMKLARPAALASYFDNKENLLQFSIYVAQNTASTGTSGGGGGGTLGGGTGGTLGGGGGGNAGTPQTVKQMENFRAVIRTTDGKAAEVYIPLGMPGGSTNKWRRLGVPLNVVSGFGKTNKEVASISFAGDAPATFYIGEVRVVTDQTPIQGSLSNSELNLGQGQEVTLWAVAEGGFSVLQYEWDFNAKDGIQSEAAGQIAIHRFRVAGEWTVTCTIKDVHGIKQPWSGTIRVTVNP
jgi:hypothetical protein